jgi:hypothetical protein
MLYFPTLSSVYTRIRGAESGVIWWAVDVPESGVAEEASERSVGPVAWTETIVGVILFFSSSFFNYIVRSHDNEIR